MFVISNENAKIQIISDIYNFYYKKGGKSIQNRMRNNDAEKVGNVQK